MAFEQERIMKYEQFTFGEMDEHGRLYRILPGFYKIASERFFRTDLELMAYQRSITKLIESSTMKEM